MLSYQSLSSRSYFRIRSSFIWIVASSSLLRSMYSLRVSQNPQAGMGYLQLFVQGPHFVVFVSTDYILLFCGGLESVRLESSVLFRIIGLAGLVELVDHLPRSVVALEKARKVLLDLVFFVSEVGLAVHLRRVRIQILLTVKPMKSIDSESNLDHEPETQVYRQMSKFQGQKGVAHIITEIITEEEYCDVNDKHKYVKEQLGRKLSTINSPTESVKSTHSSKPFESPKKHGFKKPTFFIDNSDFLTDEVREYDYIECQIKNFEKNINDTSEQESRTAAKKIVGLISKRDQYNPELHSDYHGLEEITTYIFQTKEPVVDWSTPIEPLEKMENTGIQLVDGIYAVQKDGQWVTKLHSIVDFVKDLLYTVDIANDKMITSFCQSRTEFLEQKFKMHQLFNGEREAADQKRIKNRDFYSVLKVDTHIHHSQSMNARQLLEFMRQKFRNCPDEVVHFDEVAQKPLTLKDISERFRFKPEYLNLDLLDVQADKALYKRFDRFTSKYSPLGQPILRTIFLKTDNYIKGKYIAEITHDMLRQADPHIYFEPRITIYGKSMSEWNKKAQWIIKNKLQHPNLRWIIQIPRLYSVYKQERSINCMQDMIDNIFRPLFEVTVDPSIDHDLYHALFTISAFDCVDDENQHENFFLQHLKIQPKDWEKSTNPHYAYWIYYIYANLYSLNQLRQFRGLNTFDFRPHCGAAGNIDHLACAYLLANGINHGLMLEECPVLKYLYYLKQIGISMSPIANNKLICKYSDSPFDKYFRLGMNVCLSTDDPLMLHITDQPLLEEYAIASQVFDLSNVDLAEIAKNSVRCSSFESAIKEYYVGPHFEKLHKTINNPERNNIPQSRFLFRQETLKEEYQFLKSLSQSQ